MISNNNFNVNDYYELVALQKALLEAKFNLTPNNENISGSPIIAKMLNEIYALLEEKEKEREGKERWSEWRKIANQMYYLERAIERIIKQEKFNEYEEERKREVIKNYISPFTCNAQELLLIQKMIEYR
ncbi:MAG: hypothetical protein K2N51_03520, partial [Lachnospiraceae bacterium]|nr:hypothetical protein [Lachnospiraceae bacterium]